MNTALYIIISALIRLLELYGYAIVITALCSWFLKPTNKFMQFMRSITEPVVYPFRKISMKLMERLRVPLDFSSMMAYLVLQIMVMMLQRLLY